MLQKLNDDARPRPAEAHSLAVPHKDGPASARGRLSLQRGPAETVEAVLDDDDEVLLPSAVHSLAVPLEDGTASPRAPSTIEHRALESLESALKPEETPLKETSAQRSLLPELGRFAKYLVTGKFRTPG